MSRYYSHKHITKTDILDRGWTEELFAEYIGPPCKTGIYNSYNRKYNVSVWHIDRIKTLEGYREIRLKIEENIEKKKKRENK